MKINPEKTWVPLSMLSAIVGCGIWIGTIQSKIASAEISLTKLDKAHEDAMFELRRVNEQLAGIAAILNLMRKK